MVSPGSTSSARGGRAQIADQIPISRSRSSSRGSRKGKERASENEQSSDDDEEDDAALSIASRAGPSKKRTMSVDKPSGSRDEDAGSVALRIGDVDDDDPGDNVDKGDKSGGNEMGSAGEDDEDDEDEEEEEPALKYSKLKGRLPEILAKDTASAVDVSPRVIAIGTHVGMVHIISYQGEKVNSFRPHGGSIACLKMDEENDFVATASQEGRVVIHSITSNESYAFDYKRPMKAIALEPGFCKKTTRAFVCGGLAGNLIFQEKGWLGYKEQIIHSGEGPIWAIEWRGNYIAWANDLGVKIYDTTTQTRIGYIDRGANAPRAELFKCNLLWKDDHTLVIAWADFIKVVRIRTNRKGGNTPSVELNQIFQVDCMISGISPYSNTLANPQSSKENKNHSYLILAYIAPDTYDNEATEDRAEQKRKAANRPELRIISGGEEVGADALSLSNFHLYGCNDYNLIESKLPGDQSWLVVSPGDVIVVKKRDEADHISWLVERERFEEALDKAEKLEEKHGAGFNAKAIGLRYMEHLVSQGDYDRAASLAPKVLKGDSRGWEEWIRSFAKKQQLPAIIPHIPTKEPKLSHDTYQLVFDYLLMNDKAALLKTITTWPSDVYDINNLISAINGDLDSSRPDPILLECLGELYLLNRQPAKALPYFLRLRKPYVFDLIREYNLFTAVQDQALLLVDFDQERLTALKKSSQDDDPEKHVEDTDVVDEKREKEEKTKHGAAIQLLVDHTHSIPINRVGQQLEAKPKYLYMYLDSLFDKDPGLVLDYPDRMVELYAAFDHSRLLPFLRASNFYDLEKAYGICKERDYVPEMVFLLGRMGNNRQALMLIIERLGDVQRAIDFAKEQADEDLWEDLLQYSETRPNFIRALLEHVGAEINPIRLIRRIRDGLEIPGLKPAVVKILQASNLQVSLLQGCQAILNSDCANLAADLQVGQTSGSKGSKLSMCQVCGQPAFAPAPQAPLDPALTLIYLCRHTVHAHCALPNPDVELPLRLENANVSELLLREGKRSKATRERELGGKLSYEAAVRVRVGNCPVCVHKRGGNTLANAPLMPTTAGIQVSA